MIHAAGLILLLNADNQSLQLYSKDRGSEEILRIEKSGDFGIDQIAFDGKYIVYSDCKETQVFMFDRNNLKLRKLTRKITTQAGLPRLPPAAFLAIQAAEGDERAEQLILVSKALQVCSIDL